MPLTDKGKEIFEIRAEPHTTRRVVLMRARRELQRLDCLDVDSLDDVEKVRRDLLVEASRCGDESQCLRAVISLLCDLRIQGWDLELTHRSIKVSFGSSAATEPLLEKARIRGAHLLDRRRQLMGETTRKFIEGMEERRPAPQGWASIFSCMRDGRELAEALQSARRLPRGPERLQELRRVTDPYIQVVAPNEKCELTGLRLGDIWRYFRHTWVNAYKSIPGRNMWLLIRDRACANHPVVGIAALGSSIVQIAVRDEWIGWDAKTAVANLRNAPTDQTAGWLQSTSSAAINSVYFGDFIEKDILTLRNLAKPDAATVEKLDEVSRAATEDHHRYPRLPCTSDRLVEPATKTGRRGPRHTCSAASVLERSPCYCLPRCNSRKLASTAQRRDWRLP